MLKIKSFPSADRIDLCYSHTVTRPNSGGLRTRLWARLLLLWQLAVMLGWMELKIMLMTL